MLGTKILRGLSVPLWGAKCWHIYSTTIPAACPGSKQSYGRGRGTVIARRSTREETSVQGVVLNRVQGCWKSTLVTQKYVFCSAGLGKVREEGMVNGHLPKAPRSTPVVKVVFLTCYTKGEHPGQTHMESLGKRGLGGAWNRGSGLVFGV